MPRTKENAVPTNQKRWLHRLAGISLLCAPLLAQAAGLRPGEWELQVQMNGAPPQVQQMMAAHPFSFCVPAHHPLPPPPPGCRVLHESQVGNTVTETTTCTEAGHAVTSRVRLVLSPDRRSYTAYETLLDPPPGMPAAAMQSVTHGKWLAPHCTTSAPGQSGPLSKYPRP